MISKPYRTARVKSSQSMRVIHHQLGVAGAYWQRTWGKIEVPKKKEVHHRLAR
jgi:hypothetical protein